MTNNFTQLNGIALAYMGDAAYEVFIRRHLINQGLTKPTRLQHAATNYVSAKAQAALIDLMKQNDFLKRTIKLSPFPMATEQISLNSCLLVPVMLNSPHVMYFLKTHEKYMTKGA